MLSGMSSRSSGQTGKTLVTIDAGAMALPVKERIAKLKSGNRGLRQARVVVQGSMSTWHQGCDRARTNGPQPVGRDPG